MKAGNKRVKVDTARVQKALERARKSRETKNERLKEDFKTTIENLDKIARDEVREIQDLFSNESSSDPDDAFFEELDGVVVFKDEKTDE